MSYVFKKEGGCNILITNPRDIPAFVKTLTKESFTMITGVNTLYNALLNNKNFKHIDFSELRISLGGGMAVQEDVATRWFQQTGCPLLEAYGLTETSPAVCINPMSMKKYNGFIGLPLPSTDVCVIDENEAILPIGSEGELCIKGPQVMKGYWNQPEETRTVFTKKGNWFKTGDIAIINDEGFVKLSGRKKDMIVVSGFNVYPNEIEDIVVKHPDVNEAAVIGVPHPKTGESVKLIIVKKIND